MTSHDLFHKFSRNYRYLSWFTFSTFAALGLVFALLMPTFRAPDEPVHWNTALINFHKDRLTDSYCHQEAGIIYFLNTHKLMGAETQSIETGKYRDAKNMPDGCATTYIANSTQLTYYGYPLASAFIKKFLPISDHYSSGEASILVYYATRIFQGLIIACLLARMIFLGMNRSGGLAQIGTLSILFLSIHPLFLQQSFSVSTDTVVFAAALAAVNMSIQFPRIALMDGFIYLLCAYTAIATKPVIAVPLIGWVLALVAVDLLRTSQPLSWSKAILRRRSCLFAMATFAICFLASLNIINANVLNPASSEISPEKQMQFLLANPIKGFLILHENVSSFWQKKIWTDLGWFDFKTGEFIKEFWIQTYRNLWKVELILALTSFFYLISAHKRSLRKTVTAAFGVGLFTVAALYIGALSISLVLYLVYTPPGLDTVHGVQFRYFFPNLILLLGLSKLILLLVLEDSPIKGVEAPQVGEVITYGRFHWMQILIWLVYAAIGLHLMSYVLILSFEMLKRFY